MKYLCLLAVLAFSAPLLGETAFRVPSSINEGELGEYIPPGSYEILGLSVASSSVEAIMSKLGDSLIYDGGHTTQLICYANGAHMVEFAISSMGFGYEVTQADEPAENCSETTEPMENGLGMRVGMSRSELIKLLGEPGQAREDGVSYTYWVQQRPEQDVQDALRAAHQIPATQELWLDVYSTISIGLEHDRVIQFSVFTTETY